MTISQRGTATSGLGDARLPVPQRRVLADEVYLILKEGLVSHRIAPGSRLNLDQLARELHVSNTPIRQALARLESDGLVTKQPYRGFVASHLLDSRTIAELYDYRLLIEPPSAARAARRRQETEVAHLEALCNADRTSHVDADGVVDDQSGPRDIEFHCSIARQAGNGVVAENLAATLVRMSVYTLYGREGAAQQPGTGAGEQAWKEHAVVASAIRAADPDAAAAAMREHLLRSQERFGKALG